MTSRVFVVQEPLKRVGASVVPRIPLHTLEAFGQIIYLCSWGELSRDGSDDMNAYRSAELFHKIRVKLADFGADDFLVPLGNPALIAMAVLIAAEVNQGEVAMLDWVRNAGAYRIIDIDVNCPPPPRAATTPSDERGGLARRRSRR